MKLKVLSKKYLQADTIYENQRKELQSKIEIQKRQVERLEKRLDQVYLKAPSWIDFLVIPIAKELIKLLPSRHFEILGPFGICCETAIHFYKDGVDEKEETNGDNCRSINFIPLNLGGKGSIGIRNEQIDTGEYKKDTIGELNGMNHPTIELSPDMEIKDLFQYVH